MLDKNYYSLDVCKLLMAICVIAIHTEPLTGCDSKVARDIYSSFVVMAVPYFFLSSGFLLENKMKYSFSDKSNILIVKRILFKTVKLYLLWSLIYLPLAIYHYVTLGIDLLHAIDYYVKGLLFIGEHYNSWHLWFLLSEIYAFLLILLLTKLKMSINLIACIGCVILLLSIGIDYLVSYTVINSGIMGAVRHVIQETIYNGRILTGLFYIPIGVWLSKRKVSCIVSLIVFVAGFIAAMIVDSVLVSPILIAVCSLSFFILITYIKLPDSEIWLFVRKMSIFLYFSHMYVWTAYYTVRYGEKQFGLDSFVVTVVICLIASAAYNLIRNWIEYDKS